MVFEYLVVMTSSKSYSNVMIWKVIKTAIFHNFFNIAVMIARIASLNRLYFFASFFIKIIDLYYAYYF